MLPLNNLVLQDALNWREAAHAVTLFTVVGTWGSAPRPVGSLLAIRDDGVLSGSVSGGCVEDDLVERIKTASPQSLQSVQSVQSEQSQQPAALPSVITYGVTQDEAARFGLPCGGTLRLVQEPLLETSWVRELLQRTAQHERVVRQLTLATGEVHLISASAAKDDTALHFDGLVLRTLFGPQWRVLLIGAGQLSLAVASIAQMLDFEVLICDPREEYISSLKDQSNLQGVRLLKDMPDDAVLAIKPDAHTAVVALTHDPKLDDLALMEALNSAAFYVGALGSRRNQAARKARLAEHFGLSDAALSRLHGPVGLDIGAKTPAEIAVSIVAQIVQQKYVAN